MKTRIAGRETAGAVFSVPFETRLHTSRKDPAEWLPPVRRSLMQCWQNKLPEDDDLSGQPTSRPPGRGRRPSESRHAA